MTSREIVANTPLSGAEMRKILMKDFERLLLHHGMLSDMVGYGRVSYEVTITLHTDNHLYQNPVSITKSRAIASNIVEGQGIDPETREKRPARPDLAAVEEFPLKDPSGDASLGTVELHRDINSPNEERLRHGFPVPILVAQQDGTKTMETISYPPQDLPDDKVVVTDRSAQTRAQHGMTPVEPPRHFPLHVAAELTGEILCKCGYDRDHHSLSGIVSPAYPPIEGRPACTGFYPENAPAPSEQAWPVVPSQ